jgi:hypothetical protein
MRFRLVHLSGKHAGSEHPLNAEPEMLSVGGIHVRQVAQRHIVAMAVLGVGGPPTEDALASVGLADIGLPVLESAIR